jgi:hypothetical protein
MLHKILFLAAAATLLALLTTAKVQAYGAAHVGYTHVGPNGVQHYGATAAAGPGGAYAGSHTSAYGASGGAYGAHYGGAAYGGAAHYGGYSGAAYGGAYHAGYVRSW